MKNIIFYTLIILSFSACSDDIEKPEPFLEHEEMVDLMTDMSLAEGSRMYARPSHKTKKEDQLTIEDYYALVFEKHNIDQVQLDSINSWYVKHPKQYQEIFKEVLENLNKMQAEEKSNKKLEQKKSKPLRKTNSKVVSDIPKPVKQH